MITISQRVKNLRETLGLTKSAFAERMLYDRNYVSAVEKDQRTPGPRFVAQLEILEEEIKSGLVSKSKKRMSKHSDSYSPRNSVRVAMDAAGLDIRELAARTGYAIGPLQAVIQGGGRASEKMIEAICRVLPTLEKSDLMAGSDQSPVICENPGDGTFGAKPNIRVPEGSKARFVPLLSWAQAGALDSAHLDDAYDYAGVLAVDIGDPHAFALQIRGKSMEPNISEGDRAIVCPSWQPETGDTVIAKTVTGDVMCKLYQVKDSGKVIVLSSWNERFPPLEFSAEEILWIYPVIQVLQNLRRN